MTTEEMLLALEEARKELDKANDWERQAREWRATVMQNINALETDLAGAFRGRDEYTQEQIASVRREILAALRRDRAQTMGDICDKLYTHARPLVEREVKWLKSRGHVRWTGGMGLASKYAL